MKILLMLIIGTGLLSNVFQENVFRDLPAEKSVMLSDTLKKDPETGLMTDGDLYMVKAQCTSCHSSKLIIQNRFTRDGWKQKIRWMQKNHNLWDLGETEKQVLDYLEKNYGPQITSMRRAPLKDIKWYPLEQK